MENNIDDLQNKDPEDYQELRQCAEEEEKDELEDHLGLEPDKMITQGDTSKLFLLNRFCFRNRKYLNNSKKSESPFHSEYLILKRFKTSCRRLNAENLCRVANHVFANKKQTQLCYLFLFHRTEIAKKASTSRWSSGQRRDSHSRSESERTAVQSKDLFLVLSRENAWR